MDRINLDSIMKDEDEPEKDKPKNGRRHSRIDSKAFIHMQKKEGYTNNDRLVVVRYFLDRPGYGLHNSAARLWFHPPVHCKPIDVKDFLEQQGIALPGLLVEVYLDRYESFMLLEACEFSCVEWDFGAVDYHNPGSLNIRLTDLAEAEEDENGKKGAPKAEAKPAAPSYANPTPAGLFSFSMMVAMETVALLETLAPGSVDPSYTLAHGPYMIFVGGLMQLCAASFNIMRGNLYGATAFYGFGCFWFSNGLTSILKNHFSEPGTIAYELVDNGDPWGLFFRSLFVFLFTCSLFKQTFVMSKLSTTLIFLLLLKVGSAAFTGWSIEMKWCQLVFGTLCSSFAFYVFLVELTNGMYHRDVFNTHKWSVEHSPEEVFGAAGKSGTLFSNATRLRQAKFPDVPRVRAAMDENEREVSKRRFAEQRANMVSSMPVLKTTMESHMEASKEFDVSKEF